MQEEFKMNIETVRLILEPLMIHIMGLRVMDSDAEVMRYINKGIVKTPEETWEASEGCRLAGISITSRGGLSERNLLVRSLVQHASSTWRTWRAPLEIGWRLVPEHNGKGYATEAAKAIVDYAVERVGASYLVAVADPENIASQRVMKRLGMSYKAIERHYDTECV
jgi:RimJ/RimL family protein N-acetyltransferase